MKRTYSLRLFSTVTLILHPSAFIGGGPHCYCYCCGFRFRRYFALRCGYSRVNSTRSEPNTTAGSCSALGSKALETQACTSALSGYAVWTAY